MSMATYNRPPFQRTRQIITVVAQGLLLAFCAATAYAYILLADTWINTPELPQAAANAAVHAMDAGDRRESH